MTKLSKKRQQNSHGRTWMNGVVIKPGAFTRRRHKRIFIANRKWDWSTHDRVAFPFRGKVAAFRIVVIISYRAAPFSPRFINYPCSLLHGTISHGAASGKLPSSMFSTQTGSRELRADGQILMHELWGTGSARLSISLDEARIGRSCSSLQKLVKRIARGGGGEDPRVKLAGPP